MLGWSRTCAFDSLSHQPPHKPGTVFTPVRPPKVMNLQQGGRGQKCWRKAPSYPFALNCETWPKDRCGYQGSFSKENGKEEMLSHIPVGDNSSANQEALELIQ